MGCRYYWMLLALQQPGTEALIPKLLPRKAACVGCVTSVMAAMVTGYRAQPACLASALTRQSLCSGYAAFLSPEISYCIPTFPCI